MRVQIESQRSQDVNSGKIAECGSCSVNNLRQFSKRQNADCGWQNDAGGLLMDRRQFLTRAAAPMIVPARIFGRPGQPGANDRIRVGFVGLGGRATWIITNEKTSGMEIVAAADC